MEISFPCGRPRGRTAVRPEAAGRCDVSAMSGAGSRTRPMACLFTRWTQLDLKPSTSSFRACWCWPANLLSRRSGEFARSGRDRWWPPGATRC